MQQRSPTPCTAGRKAWRSCWWGLLLLVCVVSAQPALGQGFSVILSGKVTEYFTGYPVKGAQVRLIKAGLPQGEQVTRKDGRYRFELERGWKYEVWFSRRQMVTKHVIIDTRDIPPYPDVPFYDMDLQITLFNWVDGVDLGAFNEAIGMAAYKASLHNMSWDTPYTATMRPVFSKTMDAYEKSVSGYTKRRTRKERNPVH